jgi:hypothetical protein
MTAALTKRCFHVWALSLASLLGWACGPEQLEGELASSLGGTTAGSRLRSSLSMRV